MLNAGVWKLLKINCLRHQLQRQILDHKKDNDQALNYDTTSEIKGMECNYNLLNSENRKQSMKITLFTETKMKFKVYLKKI
jgi:hypothetical protein